MLKHYLIILLLFVVDRLVKYYILAKATMFKSGGFLVLEFNQNIAWFWQLDAKLVYILLASIILVLIYFWLTAIKQGSVLFWPWSLVIIGAISNLLDRIYHGAVVDFINFFGLTIINLSDVYISLGIVWLLYVELKKARESKI